MFPGRSFNVPGRFRAVGDADLAAALDRMERRYGRARLLLVSGRIIIFALVAIGIAVLIRWGRTKVAFVGPGVAILAIMTLAGVLAASCYGLAAQTSFPRSPRDRLEAVPWRASRRCEHCGEITALAPPACSHCGEARTTQFPPPRRLSPPEPRATRGRGLGWFLLAVTLVPATTALSGVAALFYPDQPVLTVLLLGGMSALMWAEMTLAVLRFPMRRRFTVFGTGFVPRRAPLYRRLHGQVEVRYDEIVWFHLGIKEGEGYVSVVLRDGTYIHLRTADGISAKGLLRLAGGYLLATEPRAPPTSGAQS